MAKKAKAQANQVKVVSIESITKELVNNVTQQMNGAGVQLSPRTVMEVLKMAMEAVEGSPVKGVEQKDLAIKVVLEIASNVGLPEDQLTIIRTLVDGGFVSDTIDLVIAASQGRLNINQAQEVAKGCFKTCFSSMFKKRTVSNAPQQQQQQQPQQQQQQQHQQQQQQQQHQQQPPQTNEQALPNPHNENTNSTHMVNPSEVNLNLRRLPEGTEIPTQEDVIEVPIQVPSDNQESVITEQM